MDAVIATTKTAASFVPNVHAVVHHGVDTDKFHPSADRQYAWEQLGYPGKLGIATVGRVRPEKGTDIFVEAMIRLLPQNPNATALIIGRVSSSQLGYQNELRRRISAADLTQRILFTGEISWIRLPQVMRSLSLLAAPARYEGYGLTPLEAMASGVPVIATDSGHFSAFIGNSEAGTLVDAPDPSEIAIAASNMISNPIEMNRKSVQARNRAVKLFDLSSEVDGIHKVYETMWP
jgi:mannosyltransferase